MACYSMTFTIYDAQTSGAPLWSSGGMTVSITGGIFSVLFGDTGQPTLDFDTGYWLEIDIAGDIQSPRMPLSSVGYAFMAIGLVPGTDVNGPVTTGSLSAIKGVNTATSGTTYGVYGKSASTNGRGVRGYANAATGTTYGGLFESHSQNGTGVYGSVALTSGTTCGVMGEGSRQKVMVSAALQPILLAAPTGCMG
jgi:hypothetical protein